jgi:NAD-dependent protein deacetylase/lipoamidase
MQLDRYRNIVVLTGAGISKSAGLATYRGPGGLWSDPRLEELSHASALAERRVEVTDMYWRFLAAISGVAPTAAHRALAAFEERFGGNFLIVTQNVDGLHQRAGSKNVVEYHGSLSRWRCERCGHAVEPLSGEPPEHCGERMRPDIVAFGEMIPVQAEHATKRALRDCDLFVAIGTSGTVWPASSFVKSAEYAGAHRVLLNLEIFDDADELFSECHAGPSDELVPKFFG